jgi:hypothetical protein
MRRPILLAAAFALLLAEPALAHPPHDSKATASSTPEGRRADLARFRSEFLAKDRSYPPEARAEAERRLATLEREAARVSAAYFELELARIVALADNAHTVAFPGPRSRRYDRVEIRLVPFGEEFHVVRARAADADLLGARLVAVDDRPVAGLRAAARALAGGTSAWRDRHAAYFLESPEQMHALGAIGRPDSVTYRFALADGREIVRHLIAAPANGERPRANTSRWLYPAAHPAEQGGWTTLLAPGSAPWALQDPDQPFRWRDAPELGAMVIELRQNHGSDGHPIKPFLEDMTRTLREKRPRHVVLDMRMNGGGDLNTTRDFMRSLPELVPGRVFVLTSPWTFSAAISSVGYLEQAAPERVTLVGEAVGDRLRMWSEGEIVELPHSGVMILNATERHDYLTGCKGFKDCHGSVVRHPIVVPDLEPDLAAPWTLEAYRAGRDPAMEAVAKALGVGG